MSLSATTPRPARAKKSKGFGYSKYGYIFSLPFLIIFMIFTFYPTVQTLLLGFTNCAKKISSYQFLESSKLFDNYLSVLNNATFKTSVVNTIVIWTSNFIPQMFLALLLTAWFTSRHNKLRGQGFFKVVFYLPNIITMASIAVLFNNLFAYPAGPINDLLMTLGINEEAVYFLNDKTTAKAIVAFIQCWMWFGYTMIILISGVLGISPDIYEAADIDGANGPQTFFYVTIPNLRTILLYTLITSIIGGLNMFDIPQLFLNGQPDNATKTVALFIYQTAFTGTKRYAVASAASMMVFIVICIFSAFVFFIMRDKDEAAQLKAERKRIREYKKTLKAQGGRV